MAIETLFVAGDTSPDLTGVYSSDGVAVDLTGATVNLRMRRPDKAILIRAATITDAPTGAWSYTWQPGELIEGTWMVDVETTWGPGVVQTAPSVRPLVFAVRGRLSGPAGSVEVPPVLDWDALTVPDGAIPQSKVAGLEAEFASLSSTYVTFERSDTGAPITGGHIAVKVDPTTHEITDIIWEA